MHYFFQSSFIATVKSLLKKKSYRYCEQALIKDVFKPSKDQIFSRSIANRLNRSAKNPIVKMRIAFKKGKRSSYRLYFFVIQSKDALYFGHIYPKTGKKGKAALTVKERKRVIRSLLDDIKSKQLLEVYYQKEKNKIYYVESDKAVW